MDHDGDDEIEKSMRPIHLTSRRKRPSNGVERTTNKEVGSFGIREEMREARSQLISSGYLICYRCIPALKKGKRSCTYGRSQEAGNTTR